MILWFLMPGFHGAVAAQEPEEEIYRVETRDGNFFTGTILEEDEEKIVLKTEDFGEVTLRKTNIVKKTKVDPRRLVEGEYWFENPQATRYFWSPNGYGLKKGEGYYQNVWVLYNQASYGLTDYFSVGAGMVPLFLLGGTSTPVWVIPKFSIPLVDEKVNLGVGLLAGSVIGEDIGGFGIAYFTSTFGNPNTNFTIGTGWGFADGEWADLPVITLSGMFRTGARGYIITENLIIPAGDDSLLLIAFGGRRIIRNSGLDFGLIIPFAPDMNTFIAIPWLGITFPF